MDLGIGTTAILVLLAVLDPLEIHQSWFKVILNINPEI
jgi:hypothetical protein